jgi:hypothetical protein
MSDPGRPLDRTYRPLTAEDTYAISYPQGDQNDIDELNLPSDIGTASSPQQRMALNCPGYRMPDMIALNE